MSQHHRKSEAHYYCRGCGQQLPPGWRGLFHAECLKADKRRRVREKRDREREMFQAWLGRQSCPNCGALLGLGGEPWPNVESPCEASQAKQSHPK